jgi:hypothetical protein
MTITVPPPTAWQLLRGVKWPLALLVLSSGWVAGIGRLLLWDAPRGTVRWTGWLFGAASVAVCLVAVIEFVTAYRRRRGPATIVLADGELRVPYPDRGSAPEAIPLEEITDVDFVEHRSLFGAARLELFIGLRSGTYFTLLRGAGEPVLPDVAATLRKALGLGAIRVE